MTSPLIVVIYDSITNPVFASQVVEPLLKRLQENHDQQAIIISFESAHYTASSIPQYLTNNPRVTLRILKRKRFITRYSLLDAIRQLRATLAPFSAYHLIARGPLAGYIALHALTKRACKSYIIQARGLLAAEYAYTHTSTNVLKKILYTLRMRQLERLEKTIYSTRYTEKYFPTTRIEAVSAALQEYLVKHFNTQPTSIIIAQHDMPTPPTPDQLTLWRTHIRTALHVASTTHVYCYNGSLKPWQCPELVIAFFKQKLSTHNNIHLLVLTQDVAAFMQLLQKHAIAEKYYTVLCVPHAQVMHYLAACDTGLLFREAHVMNWISRPTKALEYKAAGLEIVHNNTVAWVQENSK